MKNLLKQLGISITEITYLLLLPQSTVMSWFERKTLVPFKHSVFLTAFVLYEAKNPEETLSDLAKKWEQDNQNSINELNEKALKKLRYELMNTQLQLEKLLIQQGRQLRRWHLSQKYADYLPEELRGSEQVQGWLSLIGRKSRLKYGDLRIERQKWEQKIAGIEAEIAYLELKNS
jgi:hypothetical protein